jgi:hypothetical protein
MVFREAASSPSIQHLLATHDGVHGFVAIVKVAVISVTALEAGTQFLKQLLDYKWVCYLTKYVNETPR